MDEKYTKSVLIRIKPTQLEQFQRHSKLAGKSVSEWLRDLGAAAVAAPDIPPVRHVQISGTDLMFSCSHGGRLCVCGHTKVNHWAGKGSCSSCNTGSPSDEVGTYCGKFRDRAPDTAPKEEVIPADQNLRGIAAKRIWV